MYIICCNSVYVSFTLSQISHSCLFTPVSTQLHCFYLILLCFSPEHTLSTAPVNLDPPIYHTVFDDSLYELPVLNPMTRAPTSISNIYYDPATDYLSENSQNERIYSSQRNCENPTILTSGINNATNTQSLQVPPEENIYEELSHYSHVDEGHYTPYMGGRVSGHSVNHNDIHYQNIGGVYTLRSSHNRTTGLQTGVLDH